MGIIQHPQVLHTGTNNIIATGLSPHSLSITESHVLQVYVGLFLGIWYFNELSPMFALSL
jgi:hypothetical protein